MQLDASAFNNTLFHFDSYRDKRIKHMKCGYNSQILFAVNNVSPPEVPPYEFVQPCKLLANTYDSSPEEQHEHLIKPSNQLHDF